jgi:hypothetical protein
VIHFLAKRKAIRVLRSNIRRASQIKTNKEGVEALDSWRIATARKIANIWGEQDALSKDFRMACIAFDHGALTVPDKATAEDYDGLGKACDVVQRCIRDLKENGHPKYNTQPSPWWATVTTKVTTKVTTTVVAGVMLLIISYFLLPTLDSLFGNEEIVGQDPRQIEVDLDNALKRFDFEYKANFDSIQSSIYSRFRSMPSIYERELKKHDDRCLLERNAIIDSHLTAIAIASGDTTSSKVRRILRR